MKHWALTACVIGGLLGPWCAPRALAAEEADSEARRAIRAAFVLKFMKYTQWPESAFAGPRSPVVVTVLGDAIARHLEELVKGERVQGRAIVVRRMRAPFPAAPQRDWEGFRAELGGTHALYIGDTHEPRLKAVLNAVGGTDVLTISNIEGFAQRGGMLGLVRSDERYVFEANVEAIRKTALSVSSRLLELAKVVATARAPQE